MSNVTIQDLFAKIGQLTIENDVLRSDEEMLRAELNRAAERINELEGLIPQTEEPEGSKEK